MTWTPNLMEVIFLRTQPKTIDMRAIHFPEANTEFHKPESMTDEECGSLSAYVGIDQRGFTHINTVWVPNKEDLEAILAGRPIVLSIIGDAMPPVSLFTYDEAGNINE